MFYHGGQLAGLLVGAVLVDPEEAQELVVEAWRLSAPQRLLRAYDDNTTRGSP